MPLSLPVITTTSGKLTTGSFGTAANTFCQGNDSRLSNARTPTAHTDSNGNYGKATTSVWGHTKLNSATNSTDETTAATPKAVKTAYDLANSKPSLGTTSTTAATGNHTHSNYVETSEIPRIGFYLGSSLSTGVFGNPHSINISQGNFLYIGCTDYKGNAIEGNILIEFII